MTETGNSNKWQLLLMVAIVAGVIVAGFLVFPKNEQQREALLGRIGTTNHGELLLNPISVEMLNMLDSQGARWELAQQKSKWRMLLISDSGCSGECGELLFVTRQVHLRLGKYAHRFERIYLASEMPLAPGLAADIRDNHPYLKPMSAEKNAVDAWLAQLGIASDGKGIALLVDPKGLAMMRYGTEHTGGEMLEDINHLMKYTPE